MLPSKIFCCHWDCDPGTTATWGFWIDPLPDNISYACDKHLGEMLPDDASSHHETPTRINVWSLIDGYDPTMNSNEDIEAAKFRDDPRHDASPPYCMASCQLCHTSTP